MNKKTRFDLKKVIYIITLIFFLYLVGFKYITSHEFIHQSIFNKYNISSETTLTYGLNGFTQPDSYEKCNDTCKSLNIWNDIVGYYFAVFCMFVFILYCFYFALNKGDKRQ